MTISKRLRTRYESVKSESLGMQSLRLTTAFYVTFSLWNLLLRPGPSGFAPTIATEIVFLVLLSGLLVCLGVFLLVPRKLQYLLLPIAVTVCVSSSYHSIVETLVVIPLGAITAITVSWVIIKIANFVNRL